MKDVVIIGGGAAGLFAATLLSMNGIKVTVLEHKDVIGKKLGVTGNGKCNITNMDFNMDCFFSEDKQFPSYALNDFTNMDFLDFMKNLGMDFVNKKGYVYPRSESASSVVQFFKYQCISNGVNIIYKAEVKKISGSDGEFNVQYIKDNERMDISAGKVIIAAGSKASSKTGSDGSGYYFAKTLGHSVIEPVPGLVPLVVKEDYVKELAGVRCQGKISLYDENTVIAEDKGEIQFTSYGVSGIPVFQVSRFASKKLLFEKHIKGIIDFCDEKDEIILKNDIEKAIANNKNYPLKVLLNVLFNEKVVRYAMKRAKVDFEVLTDKINKDEIEKIVAALKQMEFTIYDTYGFDNAQVCAGGVDTKEINPKTMESKLVSGVYFAGEVMDVDGKCGGYNLQWAWSSSFAAAMDIINDDRKQK